MFMLLMVDFSKLCEFYYSEKGYKDITDTIWSFILPLMLQSRCNTRDFFVIYAPFPIPFRFHLFLQGGMSVEVVSHTTAKNGCELTVPVSQRLELYSINYNHGSFFLKNNKEQ